MSASTREVLQSFFFEGTTPGSDCKISIDVLDSRTNSGLAAVAPTTISWSDGRSTARAGS
jgi:hypothetical protein